MVERGRTQSSWRKFSTCRSRRLEVTAVISSGAFGKKMNN
jgi:hypothetical protein